jgi:UPF0288 family protein (methanogenesis marker protein 3)
MTKNRPIVDQEELHERMLQDVKEKVRRSITEYNDLTHSRIQWLGSRIVDSGPRNADMQLFKKSLDFFLGVSVLCAAVSNLPDDKIDAEIVDSAWSKEREMATELAIAVNRLAERRPGWTWRRA